MISVIVPYHKGEAFLKDCLDSLKEQTYREIEILLICDHAREEDLGLLPEYEAEFPVRVYHLKDKTGVAAARNLGLDMAQGDYVYFLDSDDYLTTDTLEKLVTAAAEQDDDIVYGKKKPTWFQRSIFLARNEQQDSEDDEEENESSDGENAELNMENGGEDSKESSDDSSDEDSADKDNKNDGTDGDDEGHNEEADSEGDDTSEDEEEASAVILTEEELSMMAQARVNQAYRILVTKRKGIRNISVLNILLSAALSRRMD